MAKKIQLGCKDTVCLELGAIENNNDLLCANGKLFIGNTVAIGGDRDGSVRWTWIDVLEFLAKNWHYLLLEQTYPLNIKTLGMETLMRDFERRWEDAPEHRVEDEEERVLAFFERHDLSAGFKGIYFPSVYLMRLGNTFEVYLQSKKIQKKLPFEQTVEALSKIAEGIVEQIEPSLKPNGRARIAVDLWNSRHSRLAEKRVSISTGLSQAHLKKLDAESLDYWELEASTSLADTELMAAARMTSGFLDTEQQRDVLEAIRNLPLVNDTSTLDNLSSTIYERFEECDAAYDQGYQVARLLREELGKAEDEPVQPRQILDSWGVIVKDIELENSSLGALACWGAKHGPAIIINKAFGSVAEQEFGENSTLAHEICHLLLDRRSALPVAEVLNGNTPERLEKRARAFAAEFLLPKETVACTIRRHSDSLSHCIAELSRGYGVSERLVALQIKNSNIYDTLSDDEQSFVESKTRG